MENIVGHGRQKRFHNGISAEYSLKKLHTQNSKEVSYHKLNYEQIYIQNYTMEEEKRSKDIIKSKKKNRCKLYNSKQWVMDRL